jgi:aspartate beta-hydroxylase
MMNNRLLRYFERPEGVYHGSVFYQFSGGVGPSSVAVDKEGNIYVAQYDILTNPENPQDGRVYVLSPTGKLLALIVVPAAPQVSGVAVK